MRHGTSKEMTDKQYKRIMKTTTESYEYNIELVKHYHDTGRIKRLMWLRLMGLIETWDMK